jgi:hypothetical protein
VLGLMLGLEMAATLYRLGILVNSNKNARERKAAERFEQSKQCTLASGAV